MLVDLIYMDDNLIISFIGRKRREREREISRKEMRATRVPGCYVLGHATRAHGPHRERLG